MKSYLISFFCLTLLVGCDVSSVLEVVYFNRVKFSFTDDDNESKYIYLCVKAETKEKTKKRAVAANKYFVDNLNIITEEFTKGFFSDSGSDTESGDSDKNNEKENKNGKEKENGKENDSEKNLDKAIEAASAKLTEGSEKLALELEEKFQCLLIDLVDLE